MASKEKPMDAKWEPVKKKPSPRNPLWGGVKDVWTYAVVNLVLFYWQRKELLDPSAAVPAMWLCALLAGIAVGRCIMMIEGCSTGRERVNFLWK